MSKAVLISIQPKWCELIAKGIKTVEVRKTKPKLSTPFKCYIYCTKESYKGKYLHTSNQHGKLLFWHNPNDTTITVQPEEYDYTAYTCGGKVVGEFVCDRIDEIRVVDSDLMRYVTVNDKADMYITEEARLSVDELYDYLWPKKGFAWHISDLVIYDKPKDLSEFRKPLECHRGKVRDNCIGCWDCDITRPPQSWCYVEE